MALQLSISTSGCGSNSVPSRQGGQRAEQPSNGSVAAVDSPPTKFGGEPLAPEDGEATIPLNWLKLPGDGLVADSTGGNWQSESLGEQVAARLNALGDVITASQAKDRKSLSQFVSEDFHCNSLRPKETLVAFQDQQLTVSRGALQDAFAPEKGVQALENAVRQLLQSDSQLNDAKLRFEQKVVRVNLSDAGTDTVSQVQLFAEASAWTAQRKMTWRCSWENSAGGELRLLALRASDFEEVRARKSNVAFAEVTGAAIGASDTYREVMLRGTDHWLDRLEGRFGIFPTAWHGMAIGDVNGDGLEDIYVCEPGGLANALFVRSPDGTAEDRATAAGVDIRDQTHSALLVDLDNDSDQDLVLGTLVGVVIFANDGQGHFEHRTTKYTPDGMPFSLSAADFDEDGDLDLYVCCYSKRQGTVANEFVGIEGRPVPYHDANNGARNLLLDNLGRWQFRDATRRVGLGENNQRFSFAAAWEDYDNDGDLDLYVANDYGRNNLYRNDRGRFVDVARSAGVEDISAGMSVSWGDVDNDGWMDLYVANMFSSAGNRVTYQRRFLPSADDSTRADFQRHARGNSLFKNTGGGTFNDVSQSAAVTMGRWAWGSPLVDLNHDGLKDIVSTNGFLTQESEDDL